MNKTPDFAKGANPERVRADQERRRSSAASPQNRGQRRQATRRDAKRASIKEYS